jgi:hypothetical protein
MLNLRFVTKYPRKFEEEVMKFKRVYCWLNNKFGDSLRLVQYKGVPKTLRTGAASVQ